jgi:hypothetical protein
MSDFKIHPRDKLVPFSVATGQHHRVLIHRFEVAMVEVEDLHFHHDSAVLMPDHDPADAADPKSGNDLTALSVIRAGYLYAKENPNKKVVCLGHTDRSGKDAYNIELSRMRAQCVWAVMMGKQDDWTALCLKKHVVRDYQLILKWIANVRYWLECDPGKITGTHNDKTSRALRAFKKHYNKAYGGSLKDTGVVDKATWDAFFRMYMVGLAGIMQVDEGGLDPYRQSFSWMSPAWDGCGSSHPKTADTVGNYRSPEDRRVEVLFFEAGEEPRFGDCHPSADSRVPEQCELYRKDFLGMPFYVVAPIHVESSATVSLQLTEVRGLYKPGWSDPADVAAKTTLASGYQKGYKSEYNLGRIFINQIPRVDTSTPWDDVKKKNQQYIELCATIEVAQGVLPEDAQVVWQWTDPDDPSDTDMRDDAAAYVDPKDFNSAGKRVAHKASDNNGECDFPKPGASKEPAFEQIGPYSLTAGPAGSRSCFTLISGGKSEVRFHCTDAGGDNFVLTATVRAASNLKVTGGDATGIMTMWKRVDVEYRCMPSAESIPAQQIPPCFLKQFVQMDIREEQATKSDAPYISPIPDVDRTETFVKAEFVNRKKPGWFFICVAREIEPPVGKPRHSLYEGPAELVIGKASPPPRPPKKKETFDDRHLAQWESVVIDAVLKDTPLAVVLREKDEQIVFFAGKSQPNVPKGKTTIRLYGIDFQSDFLPADGSLYEAYKNTALYFPRYRYRWPEKVWEKKGYGFGDKVYVSVASRGASTTDGICPGATDGAGNEYFAGRTIIFCRHPSHTKPPAAKMRVGGTWSAGDVVEITVAGVKARYTVKPTDVKVPAGVTDPAFYVNGQVARGIEGAINGDPALSVLVSAWATFGVVTVSGQRDRVRDGTIHDGTPIAATPDASSGAPGHVELKSTVLQGSGFSPEAAEEIVQTFTHELGHAFGFPHKCGYYTFENPAALKCTMNYFHNWPFKLGTHLDPNAREVERFSDAGDGNHFCAHHTRGIRLAQLERNPVMWKW